MQVNVAGLRRNIKNLAHNYSDAQVKVREATSNDPWGPSATIMAEIADLTYNVVAFSEIMQMIWKRLNDHGKNWRHVYKALILLEYLIKTGTEKVAQQCKENIFAIQTLREFVYFEEGKDQGTHVREKAKQLVNLLKDDERLKNERVKALKAKERFASHPSGFGSDGYIDGPSQRDMPPGWQEEPPKSVSELEMVRPQTAGEEELQLQLAMAMSREEAEQEEAKRRSDDVRLQLALSQSEQDFKDQRPGVAPKREDQQQQQQSHLLDLLDISLGATSISSPPLGAAGGAIGGGGIVDPWNGPTSRAASQLSDPWSGTSSPQIDPWHPTAAPRGAIGPPPTSMSGGMGVLGAAGTNGSSDAWALRTQSPSVASGSSTEGWLQTNGNATNGIGGVGGGGVGPSGAANAVTDPWLTKTSATPVMGAVPPTTGAISRGASADAWLGEGAAKPEDPWAPKTHAAGGAGIEDPWRSIEHPGVKKLSPDMDEFDIITNRSKGSELILTTNSNASNNNNASLLDEMDPLSTNYGVNHSTGATSKKPLKDPQSFLGENSALVNLDNLIKPIAPQTTTQPGGAAAYNPFSDTVIPPKTNLFQQQQPAVPSINQLKQQAPFAVTMNQDPWAPVTNNTNMTSQQAKDFPINNDSQTESRNLYPAIIQTPRPTSLNLNQMANTYNNASNFNTFHDAAAAATATTANKHFITNSNVPDNANHKSQHTLTHSRSLFFNYNPKVESLRNMEIESTIELANSLNGGGVGSGFNRMLPTPTSPTALPTIANTLNNNNANYNNNINSNINNNNNNNDTMPYTNFAQSYSNALSASLAATPGVVIKPLVQTVPDLVSFNVGYGMNNGSGGGVGGNDGYGGLTTTPVTTPTSFAGFSTALYEPQPLSTSSFASATTTTINPMMNYCKLESNNNNNNTNNNMPWIKPEAAATNPFLS